MEKMIGWRKILVWGVLTGLNVLLLWFGRIQAQHWVDLEMWTTMSLLAANALTHVAQAFGRKP